MAHVRVSAARLFRLFTDLLVRAVHAPSGGAARMRYLASLGDRGTFRRLSLFLERIETYPFSHAVRVARLLSPYMVRLSLGAAPTARRVIGVHTTVTRLSAGRPRLGAVRRAESCYFPQLEKHNVGSCLSGPLGSAGTKKGR